MARIICMASAKGGSGKTSLTATFATFLSKIDRRVLMIDADPATNGLTLLYVKEMLLNGELIRSKGHEPIGLHEALFFPNKRPDIFELTPTLHILPATFSLQIKETPITEEVVSRMRNILHDLRDIYDYIFIDSQAGADDMACITMSRKISNEVVIVSEYDPMSAAGVERLKGFLRDDLTYERTWVLLNKILPEFAQNFSDFLDVAKYLNPIPWDADVVRSYARRRLAIDVESGNSHTLAVFQALRGLVEDATLIDLEKWILTRAAIVRQPIEQQYLDAEREMKELLKMRAALKYKIRLVELIFATTLGGAAALISILATKSGFLFDFIGRFISSDYRGIVAIAALLIPLSIYTMIALPMFRKIIGLDTIDGELTKQRYDRQLSLLNSRLRQLELLRTLDPEALLKRKIIPIESYSPSPP